jgi:RecA-family ATPase
MKHSADTSKNKTITSKFISGNAIKTEMARVAQIGWIIEDLLPETSNIIGIYGAPSSYKSFITLDMVLSVANGTDYHGRKIEQGQVVYIAAEGAAGTHKRVAAWHKSRGIDNISSNFFLHDGAISLHDKQQVAQLISDIKASSIKPKFIVFDTLARCFGDVDENSNQAMGAAVNACDTIRKELNTKIILVHHTGKDAAKGMRGGSALIAGLDTSIEVKAVGAKACRVKVKKQKDSEDGQRFFYKMESINLNVIDRKGNILNSLAPIMSKDMQQSAENSLRGKKAQVHNALIAAVKESGTQGATLEQWRQAFYLVYGKEQKERTAFSRHCKELLSTELVYTAHERYFLSEKQ